MRVVASWSLGDSSGPVPYREQRRAPSHAGREGQVCFRGRTCLSRRVCSVGASARVYGVEKSGVPCLVTDSCPVAHITDLRVRAAAPAVSASGSVTQGGGKMLGLI